MNVGELRQKLAYYPADTEVKFRLWDDIHGYSLIQMEHIQMHGEPVVFLAKKDE